MKANIPEDWDNETWASFCIQWPDSPAWISILSGLMASPSNGRNWTRESGTITDAQEIGNEIWARYQAQTGCDEMDVRQNPDLPCSLEKDPGTGWEQFADLSLCGASMFEDPPYNGEDFELTADDCLTATRIAMAMYNLLLELSDNRSESSDLQTMFFLTLQQLATEITYPNVNQLLALASALYSSTDETNLIAAFNTAFRMALTCEIITSLAATTGETLFTRFREIRDHLAAWAASYSFDGDEPLVARLVFLYYVQCCHTADFMRWYVVSEIEEADCYFCSDQWCYIFDFTTGQLGWACDEFPGEGRSYGSYSTGVGFVGEQIGNEGEPWSGAFVYIHKDIGASANITYVEFNYTVSSTITGNNYGMIAWYDGSWHILGDGNYINEGTDDFGTVDLDVNLQHLWVGMAVGWRPQTIRINSVIVHGTGSNPFGEDNCQ